MAEGRRGAMIGKDEALENRPDAEDCWDAADAVFPVRITRSFWEAMADPSDPEDPLALQVVPSPLELESAPDDLQDPVGDKTCSPIPWVVRKYPSRVLLLVTKRCHVYCRYCFRRTHKPGDALDPTQEEKEAMLAYVAANPEISEVILSGGDPLSLHDKQLAWWLAELAALDPSRVVRLHTRAPITCPSRVSERLIQVLHAAGSPIWVIVHCNHPRELSPDVRSALAKLVDAGVPVLNQSVLLAGVNDDAQVLAELSEELVRCRVFPYYLHHTDSVAGNAHLRVSLERGGEIVRQLASLVSGIAMPRYVLDPPDGSGKVSALDVLSATPSR